MTVYVDDAAIPASVRNGARTHTSSWSHLTADSTGELIEFVVRIGLKPAWIQHRGTPLEHFDVTAPKRLAAIRSGAVPITWREGAAQVIAKRCGVPFDLGALRARL